MVKERRYRLDIVGLTLTQSMGSGIKLLESDLMGRMLKGSALGTQCSTG